MWINILLDSVRSSIWNKQVFQQISFQHIGVIVFIEVFLPLVICMNVILLVMNIAGMNITLRSQLDLEQEPTSPMVVTPSSTFFPRCREWNNVMSSSPFTRLGLFVHFPGSPHAWHVSVSPSAVTLSTVSPTVVVTVSPVVVTVSHGSVLLSDSAVSNVSMEAATAATSSSSSSSSSSPSSSPSLSSLSLSVVLRSASASASLL